jgi:RimJ/RimL family protein N-acetyltransferase
MQIYLETERLTLRCFNADDVDNLMSLDGDPAVMRLINGGVAIDRQAISTVVLPRILAWTARSDDLGYWAAIQRHDQTFIGWFHLRPPTDAVGSLAHPSDTLELGYRLRRSSWGQGLATEGAQALVRRGLGDLGAGRVVATTLAEHSASRRVLEKVGLRHVRDFTYMHADPTVWHHGRAAVEYALSQAAYLASATAGERRQA